MPNRQSICVLAIPLLLLFCADPPDPFTEVNTRITARCADFTVLDDSLAVTIMMDGAEFIDSLTVMYDNCVKVLRLYDPLRRWSDTARIAFVCTSTGNSVVAVTGYVSNGELRHDSCIINVLGKPAKFVEHPADQFLPDGDALRLSSTVAGSDTLQYAWFRDDSLLPGQSTSKLFIDPVSLHDAGVYHCVSWNNWGRPDTSGKACVAVARRIENFELSYDTSLTIMRQNMSKDVVVRILRTGAADVSMRLLNMDDISLNTDTLLCVAGNNSAVFRVVPRIETKYDMRFFTITAVFDNGMMADTVHLRLGVRMYEQHPIWISGNIAKTVIAGEDIRLSLSKMIKLQSEGIREMRLLDGLPENDVIGADGMTYLLKSVYAIKGRYEVHVEATDFGGIRDTVAIDLKIE